MQRWMAEVIVKKIIPKEMYNKRVPASDEWLLTKIIKEHKV